MSVYYMSNYVITKYTYDKAEQNGLTIKVSKYPQICKTIFILQALEILDIKTIQIKLLYTIWNMQISEEICIFSVRNEMLM